MRVAFRICFAFVLALFVLAPATALAAPPDWESYSHPTAGVQISLPPGWPVSGDETSLTGLSPDNSVYVNIGVWNDRTLSTAAVFDAVTSGIRQSVSLAGESQEIPDLNGLHGWFGYGVATDDGDGSIYGIFVMAFTNPVSDSSGFVLVLADPSALDQYQDAIIQILTSVSPI